MASHSKTNFKDKQSIGLVENILSNHGRVMPKLESIDKWPNIDGTLDIHDKEGELIGKFEPQVKTLPSRHNLKVKCPTSFISYCKIAPLPVILLGVDNPNRKIFWLHFDRDFIQMQIMELYGQGMSQMKIGRKLIPYSKPL